jgi:hypothetical protein
VTATSIVGLLVLLAAAWVVGRLVRRHVPDLVAYVLVGAGAGPTGLGLITRDDLVGLRPLTIGASGLVLVGVGRRLTPRVLRETGWVAPVALTGYLAAGLATFVAMRAVGASYVLAALAATLAGGGAPMTVSSIVRRGAHDGQYARALVSLHGACDALVALGFAVALPVAIVLAGTAATPLHVVGDVVRLGAAGAAVGALAGLLALRIGPLLPLAGAIGFSWALGLSVPLAALTLGAVVAARGHGQSAQALFAPIARLEPMLYLLFFALGGAAIRLNALDDFAVVAIAYIGARPAAKLAAAVAAGGAAGGLRARVRLGLGSLPHAGISPALAAAASAELPRRGVVTVTLAGVVVFELVGALIVAKQLRDASRAPAQERRDVRQWKTLSTT